MRNYGAFLITSLAFGWALPAHSQDSDAQPGAVTKATCETYRGSERSQCLNDLKRAETKAGPSGGPSAKDAKLINETNAAAQVKSQAGDFAGAAALYDEALAKAGKTTPKQYLLVGKAIAQRRLAVAAYNAGGQPSYPPPGAGNDAIHAANAANAALQARKTAAALPLMKVAMATAVEAATLADSQQDKAADPAIAAELREDAGLLYRLDRNAVIATPRASAALEVAWLRKWFAGTPAPSLDDLNRYGFAVAAAELARDRNAGLALADEVLAKAGTDQDATIGYAELIAAAKLPANDPRRVKAAAAITTIETTGTTNDAQKAKIREIKAALTAPA